MKHGPKPTNAHHQVKGFEMMTSVVATSRTAWPRCTVRRGDSDSSDLMKLHYAVPAGTCGRGAGLTVWLRGRRSEGGGRLGWAGGAAGRHRAGGTATPVPPSPQPQPVHHNLRRDVVPSQRRVWRRKGCRDRGTGVATAAQLPGPGGRRIGAERAGPARWATPTDRACAGRGTETTAPARPGCGPG